MAQIAVAAGCAQSGSVGRAAIVLAIGGWRVYMVKKSGLVRPERDWHGQEIGGASQVRHNEQPRLR